MSMLLGLEDCCFVWRLVCVFLGSAQYQTIIVVMIGMVFSMH